MKLISCHDGKLHAVDAAAATVSTSTAGFGKAFDERTSFRTGLAAFDSLAPGGLLSRGAVHELLHAPADPTPMFPAGWLAARARDGSGGSGAVVWCDPERELYPLALAALGVPLARLLLLRPGRADDDADRIWALAECLGCKGVAAVVAALPANLRLNRATTRRLQLAAERGGGVGLLLRVAGGRYSQEHAAVTRWLVCPERGKRKVQRWRIQLIFGHGGQVGQSIILEHHRDAGTTTPRIEAHPVHPAAELADRPAVPSAG